MVPGTLHTVDLSSATDFLDMHLSIRVSNLLLTFTIKVSMFTSTLCTPEESIVVSTVKEHGCTT